MGNQQSSTQLRSQKHSDPTNLHRNTEISNAFQKNSGDGGLINLQQFQVFLIYLFLRIYFQIKAGKKLSTSLWKSLQNDSEIMNKEQFEKLAHTLSRISSSGLVKILMPAKNLVLNFIYTL